MFYCVSWSGKGVECSYHIQSDCGKQWNKSVMPSDKVGSECCQMMHFGISDLDLITFFQQSLFENSIERNLATRASCSFCFLLHSMKHHSMLGFYLFCAFSNDGEKCINPDFQTCMYAALTVACICAGQHSTLTWWQTYMPRQGIERAIPVFERSRSTP